MHKQWSREVDSVDERSLALARRLDSGDTTDPILLQVGLLGQNYSKWVHRPVNGRPRFFKSDILENITKTPWWMVPLLWTPFILGCLAVSFRMCRDVWDCTIFVAAGVLLWQLIEYTLHRCLFHTIPDHYWGITLHFLFHGCHHKFPMDQLRLVFPPLPAAAIAAGIYFALQAALPPDMTLPVFTGVILGYDAYDCLHYFLHHGRSRSWLEPLRRAHLHHHYKKPDRDFGISSPLFDVLLSSQA